MFRQILRSNHLIRTSTRFLSEPPAVLPDLKFGYDELAPHLDSRCLDIHHSKHHKTYVNNFNMFTEKLLEAKQNLSKSTLSDKEKFTLETEVDTIRLLRNFNGGGHFNHSFYWENMSKNGGGDCPEGSLKDAIIRDFESVENLKKQLTAASVSVQGSGWGWLGYNNQEKKLKVLSTANQDLLSDIYPDTMPLIAIDVWEHAYYLQYKNVRPDYVANFWNVLDWDDVIGKYKSYV